MSILKKLIAAALIAAMCLSLAACSGAGKGVAFENALLDAYLDEDGNACFPGAKGEGIKVRGEYVSGYIGRDRKRIVLLDEDGTLCLFNAKGEDKVKIAEDVVRYGIRNDGLLYACAQETTAADEEPLLSFYRYMFKSGETFEYGSDIDSIMIADNTVTLLITGDGKVTLSAAGSNDPVTVCRYDEDVSIDIIGVSDDGKLAVWTETSENDDGSYKMIIYTWDNGEKQKVDTVDSSFATSTRTYFSTAKKGVLIVNNGSSRMYLKYPGHEVQKISLGGELYGVGWIYSDRCLLSYDRGCDFFEFYVGVLNEKGNKDICYVTAYGDKSRMVSNVVDFEVTPGSMYYINDSDTLYGGALKGDVLDDAKISSNVSTLEIDPAGNGIYYMKNMEGDIGDLYWYDLKADESVRLARDVYGNSINASTDGKRIYYYTNYETTKEGSGSIGTLCMLERTDPELAPVELAEDVLIGSLFSGRYPYFIEPDYMMYCEYSGFDEEHGVLGDYIFFNGKDTTTLGRDTW